MKYRIFLKILIPIFAVTAGCSFSSVDTSKNPEAVNINHNKQSCPDLTGNFWDGNTSSNLKVETKLTDTGAELYLNRFYEVDGLLHQYKEGVSNASLYKAFCKNRSIHIEFYDGKVLEDSITYSLEDDVLTVTGTSASKNSLKEWRLAPRHNDNECPRIDGQYRDMDSNESLQISFYKDNDLSSGISFKENNYFYSLRLKGKPFEVEYGQAPFTVYAAGCSDNKITIDSYDNQNGLARQVISLYENGILVKNTASSKTTTRILIPID